MVHFCHLRLRAITSDGTYGTDLPLRRGLNILSAGNTTGKSTCLQALLYALGLERMLSPRREIPLAYVMREHVGVGEQARGPSVFESYVTLELENSEGEPLTVRRHVQGGPDWKLVSTWNRHLISDPSSMAEQRDFFVRDPGAARREAGFHPFLARFLGWQLPEVPTYDGDLVPLYMETIFPLLFVEQKAGWSTIQGPFPTYLGIQDVGRRVVEFLLDLDAQRVRVSRNDLRRKISETLQHWREANGLMNRKARDMNVNVQGVPDEPTGQFVLEPKAFLQVYREGGWKDLHAILRAEQERLEQLGSEEIPTADEQAGALATELETLRDPARSIVCNP